MDVFSLGVPSHIFNFLRKERLVLKKFLKTFRNEYADKNINMALAKREVEPPLYEFILDVFSSFERTGYITLVDWKHIEDESKIDVTRFNITRKKKSKSKKNNNRIVDIDYDRVTLLWMLFRIEVKGEVAYKDVYLLLPKYDDDYFMCLKGKRVYLLYQLVNSSTYVTKNSVTLKGLMPLCINRQTTMIEDSHGEEFKTPFYRILNFNKEFNPVMIFSCKFGFYGAIGILECSNILKVVRTDEPEEPGWLYFIPKILLTTKRLKDADVKIKVVESMFRKYTYLKAVTAMAVSALSDFNRPTLENIADNLKWLDELGSLYTGDKTTSREIGKSTLVFFERLVDNTNKRVLRLYEYNKRNVYTLTSSIIQNFDEFKKKDNNDINSRRLRLNECIGSITSIRMGKSINRILSKGEKVTLDEVLGVLKIAPNLIFRLLYKSELITYNDITNDMDFFNAFKFSIRG